MKLVGWVIAIILAATGVVVGISLFLSPDDLRQCGTVPAVESENCSRADAIVAISGGDTRARTAEAIDLYDQGWADTLIFSGAAFDTDSPSNARAMKAQAISQGVPETAIIIEEAARDTSENAEKTLSVVAERNMNRVILVTSPYHQRRASMEFRRIFGEVVVLNHPVQQDQHWSDTWWLTPRGWYLALGELVKIIFLWAKSV